MTINIQFTEEDLKNNNTLSKMVIQLLTTETLPPAVKTIPPVIKKVYTLDDLRKASAKVLETKGREFMVDLIQKAGGNKLTDIDKSQYADLMAKLTESA